MNAALDFFYLNGYENTSVNSIIKKVGVSKGAFYYYFESKEDLLEKLAQKQAEEVIETVKQITENKNLNALEKLNRVFIEATSYKTVRTDKRMKLFQIIRHHRDNLKLQHKVINDLAKMISPYLLKIFKQGVKERTFNNPYPEELSEFYVRLSGAYRDMVINLFLGLHKKPENMEILKKKLFFYDDLIERILGAKEGSILLAEALLENYERELKKSRRK